MPRPTLPLEGGCRCGQVRIRVTAPPMVTMACHCVGCQKMSASAYSLSAMFPADAFEVIAGETVIGGLHGEIRHNHCPHCLSWMFTRFPADRPMVNVRATMLDDVSWYRPFIECCTLEKLPWAGTGATHGFEVFPGPGDYPGLIQAYAATLAD
ncbi:MAG: aldehyde-activating protein [Caulobacter sp.]|nr:aldehyde-activating protein [Caulobacter sp.]